MTMVGVFKCDLHVVGDIRLQTHIREQTRHSVEGYALIPSLAPLAFSISVRLTDYYTFPYGFAIYIFVDGAHHINGCWTGKGEGKGLFRGRQKTVDGRAVVDGEWRLAADGVQVVKPQLGGSKGRVRVGKDTKMNRRRKSQSTIEIVILRVEKQDPEDYSDSMNSSEVDIERPRSSAAVTQTSKVADCFQSGEKVNPWRNSSTDSVDRQKKEMRINEFERAIGIRKHRPTHSGYCPVSNSSDDADNRENRRSHDVQQLRSQLSNMLCKKAPDSQTSKSIAPAAPYVSPVESGSARFVHTPEVPLTPLNHCSQGHASFEPTDAGGSNKRQSSRQRHPRRASFSSSSGGTSSSSSSSSQLSDGHDNANHSGTGSMGSDDTGSSSSEPSSDSESESSTSASSSDKSHSHSKKKHTDRRRNGKSKQPKPHKLFRKHWQYRDKSSRSRTFGGKHPRPPYQARHRITPVWVDTLERPYAIFKFRIANAQVLQNEYGLSADEVDGLGFGSRQRERILNSLNTNELRELVRSGCATGDADSDTTTTTTTTTTAAATHYDSATEPRRRKTKTKKQHNKTRRAAIVNSPEQLQEQQEQTQDAQAPVADATWGGMNNQSTSGWNQAAGEDVGGW